MKDQMFMVDKHSMININNYNSTRCASNMFIMAVYLMFDKNRSSVRLVSIYISFTVHNDLILILEFFCSVNPGFTVHNFGHICFL